MSDDHNLDNFRKYSPLSKDYSPEYFNIPTHSKETKMTKVVKKKKVVKKTKTTKESKVYYTNYLPETDSSVLDVLNDLSFEDAANSSDAVHKDVVNCFCDDVPSDQPKEYYEVKITVEVSGPKPINYNKKSTKTSKKIQW